MTRIVYALVIVGSAGLFHYINGYFSDIKIMRSDNATLKASNKTLVGVVESNKTHIQQLIAENKRLAQIDANHRTNMTNLTNALAIDRKEHLDEIEALESANAGVCHVRVPDAIRRMHADRAKQINNRTSSSDNQTSGKGETRPD